MGPHILILADDLTGANDTAVQFADNGFATLLVSSPEQLVQLGETNYTVVAINSGARPLGELAKEVTRKLIQSSFEVGFNQLYLKVDSTMRGSVPQQISGALAGLDSSEAIALVCTAYPEMGRTVREGILYVGDELVAETRSGQDPITPILSSKMTDLIPGSQHISVTEGLESAIEKISASSANVFTFDAQSREDLNLITSVANILPNPSILVGSAGLAQAYIQQKQTTAPQTRLPIPVDAPPLVVVTSIHDVSQQQVDEYISTSTGVSATVFSPAPSQLMQDSAMSSLLRQISVLSENAEGVLVLRANPTAIAPIERRAKIASDFATKLAVLTKQALNSGNFGSLVIVGGDGSAACFTQLDISSTQIYGSIDKGVPFSIAADGPFEGLPIITKSGGFGEPRLLTNIIDKLWEGTDNE